MMKNFTKLLMILLAYSIAAKTNAATNYDRMLDVTTQRDEGKATNKTKQLKKIIKNSLKNAQKLYTAMNDVTDCLKKANVTSPDYESLFKVKNTGKFFKSQNPTVLPTRNELKKTFEQFQHIQNVLSEKTEQTASNISKNTLGENIVNALNKLDKKTKNKINQSITDAITQYKSFCPDLEK